MQDELMKPTDVVDKTDVSVAVAALREIAGDPAVSAVSRVEAAQTLLRYGVRDPYWMPTA